MDNKKFEKLIDLIINENEEQARELFHDIIVEKSREIYESIMDEEMGGQVGDLLDEIDAEESGEMSEGEGEEGLDDLSDLAGDEEEVIDMDADDMSAEEGEGEELEDAVVRIEDKLDQLMAEFEQIMGSDEEAGEEDFGGEEEAGEEDFGGEEEAGEEGASDEEAGEEMMESVQLKQVGGNTYNAYGKMGDDGDQKKSPGLQNSGQAGMDSKPVKFSGAAESVPNSPKAPSNAYTKGETQVKGAGQFKNAPAQKTQDLGKAPAPVKSQASGVNTKSPVAEAKKATKKIVK